MWEDDWFWSFYDEEEELEEYMSQGALMDDLYKAALIVLSLYVRNIKEGKLADRAGFWEQLDRLVMMIRSYIEGRLEAASPFRLFHFIRFCKEQELMQWQIWVVLFAGVERYYPESAELFAQIFSDKRHTYMSMDLVYRVCRDLYHDNREVLADVRTQTEYWSLLFEKNNEFIYGGDNGKTPLRLRDELYLFFLGNIGRLEEHKALTQFYDGSEKPEDMVGRRQELERFVRFWMYQEGRSDVCIAVTGARRSGRKLLVRHAAARLKKKVLFVDFEVLTGMEDGGAELDRLCFYAKMLGAEICLAGYGTAGRRHDEDWRSEGSEIPVGAGQWITACRRRYHMRFLATASQDFGGVEQTGQMWVCVGLDEPDAEQMLALWCHFTERYRCQGISAPEMAGRYRLSAGDIRDVFGMAHCIARSFDREDIISEDIVTAVKSCNGRSLGEYADALKTGIGWQELVVDEDTMTQLRYIENRLKYKNTVGGKWGFDRKVSYGKGTCALFYGPAGTGKTMAAKVLANELGLALYRVDLSRMVSKYIGETQKHISALFEHAKGTNALLFFDEADALFAKRTEVGDSHDRNANSEVAHLLQKLEEYDGISILATNLKDNIDDAFKRRIKYMIHFRMPDAETRALLWRKMLPEKAPADEDLDLAFFAENFELSGSEIKDAMLHAAYMAAAEGGSIGNRHLMEAVQLSFSKYGKVLTKENFGYIGL